MAFFENSKFWPPYFFSHPNLPVRVPRTVNDFIASRPSVDIFHDPIGKLKKEIASFTSTLDIFI